MGGLLHKIVYLIINNCIKIGILNIINKIKEIIVLNMIL